MILDAVCVFCEQPDGGEGAQLENDNFIVLFN